MYNLFFKRFIDVVVAFFGLLILSPFFLLITIGLLFVNKGKPFFVQSRPGKKGKIFKVIKFKTMTDETDSQRNLLQDADRLTKIGKYLRSSSLDELPQLINILKGDMSLIGPRPLLIQYLPLYNERQALRHEVRPGITGWAQINGRNAISWNQKFELDVWYIEHLTLMLDIKIIFKSVIKVLHREGINSETNATMEMFIGEN